MMMMMVENGLRLSYGKWHIETVEGMALLKGGV